MKEMDQTEYAYKNGYRKALEDVREKLRDFRKSIEKAIKLQGAGDDFRWGTMEGCERCIYAVEDMITKEAKK